MKFGELDQWEYRLAMCDELVLERIIIEEGVPDDEFARRSLSQDKIALREIDRLKVEGSYETERARLCSLVGGSAFRLPKLDERLMSATSNLLAGLRSPDPDQRERFRRFYEVMGIADKAPCECRELLMVLEPAQRPPNVGRPTVCPPWANVVEHMDSMRFAVARGGSIPEAARRAAEIEGMPQRASRAKYFERLYRKRIAFRSN